MPASQSIFLLKELFESYGVEFKGTPISIDTARAFASRIIEQKAPKWVLLLVPHLDALPKSSIRKLLQQLLDEYHPELRTSCNTATKKGRPQKSDHEKRESQKRDHLIFSLFESEKQSGRDMRTAGTRILRRYPELQIKQRITSTTGSVDALRSKYRRVSSSLNNLQKFWDSRKAQELRTLLGINDVDDKTIAEALQQFNSLTKKLEQSEIDNANAYKNLLLEEENQLLRQYPFLPNIWVLDFWLKLSTLISEAEAVSDTAKLEKLFAEEESLLQQFPFLAKIWVLAPSAKDLAFLDGRQTEINLESKRTVSSTYLTQGS